MIKISNRLEAISTLVENNSNVIDIGCDHGLLDIYMYQLKICNKIIATDICESALNNAINNIKKYKLEKYIDTRLGNGLDVIDNSDNIDTIIISGMGYNTIRQILFSNKSKLDNVNTIIIQSNTKLELLRKDIIKLNYYINDEIIVKEKDKYYIIIKFIKGKKKYNKKELFLGPILMKKHDKIFIEYCNYELTKLKILEKLLPKNKILIRLKNNKKIKIYNSIINNKKTK